MSNRVIGCRDNAVQYNMISQYSSDRSRKQIILSTHKRQLIPHPYRWAMRCLLWLFRKNIYCIIMAPHCISSTDCYAILTDQVPYNSASASTCYRADTGWRTDRGMEWNQYTPNNFVVLGYNKWQPQVWILQAFLNRLSVASPGATDGWLL